LRIIVALPVSTPTAPSRRSFNATSKMTGRSSAMHSFIQGNQTIVPHTFQAAGHLLITLSADASKAPPPAHGCPALHSSPPASSNSRSSEAWKPSRSTSTSAIQPSPVMVGKPAILTMAQTGGNANNNKDKNSNSKDKNSQAQHSRLAKAAFWRHHKDRGKNEKQAHAQQASKPAPAKTAQLKPVSAKVVVEALQRVEVHLTEAAIEKIWNERHSLWPVECGPIPQTLRV
jgi:hypothetical protein